ncbi:MAG: S-layer homology domain-containing protein [Candidatus Velthaea sp.]
MKRLATLVLAAGFSLGSLVAMGQGASATPFSDVPANHWAYQAIQSLAADGLVEGYPDGKFKGDRPLSRYEMAVLVARVIAKVQANGAGYASKADLDKLQKLIDALKDELDSLGVRVTNVEDALDALDKRTKFAQSLQMHGSLFHNVSTRATTLNPHTIVNGTGVAQNLYYGGADAANRTANIDPFIAAFLRSDESNSPLVQAGSGNKVRFDDKINLSYAINENLTVAFPIHVLNYEYSGEFTPDAKFAFQPDILVNIAKAGNLTNMYMRFGALDNLKSSRVGLTYRAPDASLQGPGFQYPFQPYQKGAEFGGTLNGLTEFQMSFSRVDQTLINTQTGVMDQTGSIDINAFFFPVNHNQVGYTQVGPPGAITGGSLKSNTFTSGDGSLTQVFLGNRAQIGTVYISQYNGSLFNNAGQLIGGVAGGPAAPPAFTYNDTFNAVVFGAPLPAGASVTITYVGLTLTNNNVSQRYQITGRLNHKIKGLPGAEVGLSFSRLFDFDDLTTTGDLTLVNAAPSSGYGLVSDTVLGIDAQLPLTFLAIGGDRTQHPILYAETAFSKFTPDFRNVSAISDSAAVVGVRLKVYQITGSLQYQVVGANFMDGAPVRYFGNAPQLYSFNKLNYFPQFFGFANNLGINQQFDNFTGACAAATPVNCTTRNPNLTFIYPVFNPFVATSPTFYSAFAPNSFGPTLNVNSPIRLGDITLNGRLLAQRLSEIQPNGLGTQFFAAIQPVGGQAFVSNRRMTLDKVEGGVQFNLPAFGQQIGLNLTAGVERLSRQDKTRFTYVPINPGTLTQDPAAAALTAAQIAAGSGTVPFFPNFVDETHTTFVAAATVPLTKDVVFGATYNSQGYHGSNGTTATQNIAERKDTYVGSLTYNIPRTTSSVAFAVRHYSYNDLVIPSFNFNQNREDLNFVVRF